MSEISRFRDFGRSQRVYKFFVGLAYKIKLL